MNATTPFNGKSGLVRSSSRCVPLDKTVDDDFPERLLHAQFQKKGTVSFHANVSQSTKGCLVAAAYWTRN